MEFDRAFIIAITYNTQIPEREKFVNVSDMDNRICRASGRIEGAFVSVGMQLEKRGFLRKEDHSITDIFRNPDTGRRLTVDTYHTTFPFGAESIVRARARGVSPARTIWDKIAGKIMGLPEPKAPRTIFDPVTLEDDTGLPATMSGMIAYLRLPLNYPA
jgi:hypothetical protein